MTWTYRPELDGLRFVAVYLVVAFHAGMATVSGGFVGVDLFFVLSGFLVTSVILAAMDAGTFSLGWFYSRRVRRLLPAAVVVIVLTALVQTLVVAEPSRLPMVAEARASLLYVANWQFIAESRDYFAADNAPSPFLHFWSLSIEEQFYIVYPPVLALLLLRWRRSRSFAAGLFAALTLVSVALQVVVARDDVNVAYYATHTRIYQPLLGCVLALALSGRGARRPGRSLPWGPVAGAGLLAVLVLGSSLVDVSQSVRGLLTAGASALTIAAVFLAPRSWVSRALALTPLQYLGRISYGTYLWHWPVILVLREVLTVRPLIMLVLAAAVATGLAALSDVLLERPIRSAPRLHGLGWQVVAAGLAVSVVAAVAVVPPILHSDRRVALVVTTAPPGSGVTEAQALAPLDEPVPSGIDFARLEEDEGDTGDHCPEGTPESCAEVTDGDGPLVVLVGDSHAAMLSPALQRLAREEGFRLSTAIMNNCPWQRGVVIERSPKVRREECAELQQRFYDRAFPQMDADLVVVLSKPRSGERWARQVSADDAAEHPGETYPQMMLRKAQETSEELTGRGARVLIVHSVFGTGGYDLGGPSPLDCLATARRLLECAVTPPAKPPLVDSLYDYVATAVPDVFTADLRTAYCPEPVCAPMLDDVVVWRDPSHLSTDLVVARRAEIWRAIVDSGAWEGLG